LQGERNRTFYIEQCFVTGAFFVKFLPAFLLLLGVTAFAQDIRGSAPAPNSVSVGAEGEFEAAPDTAVITCSLSAQENTSQQAFQSASRLAEQMRQALRKTGIDPKTVELSQYSLYPVLDYKNPKQKVVAYRVGTTVTIKLKDFSKVGPVTESLAGLDGITGQNMNYQLEDMDSAKAKAIENAYGRARSYAETLAKASGKQLGTLTSAAVDAQEPIPIRPIMRSMQMAVAGAAPAPTEEFEASRIKITAHVNAVFALQ
jgi:hypothetical protein